MAFRIAPPSTAFANAPSKGQKRPRIENERHLAWIRTLPCLITGRTPVEAAHIRYADPAYGKRDVGTAEKPDDRWTVPLAPVVHREQHSGSEREFWKRHGIDPCRVALALYAVSGDDEQGAIILKHARSKR